MRLGYNQLDAIFRMPLFHRYPYTMMSPSAGTTSPSYIFEDASKFIILPTLSAFLD